MLRFLRRNIVNGWWGKTSIPIYLFMMRLAPTHLHIHYKLGERVFTYLIVTVAANSAQRVRENETGNIPVLTQR